MNSLMRQLVKAEDALASLEDEELPQSKLELQTKSVSRLFQNVDSKFNCSQTPRPQQLYSFHP